MNDAEQDIIAGALVGAVTGAVAGAGSGAALGGAGTTGLARPSEPQDAPGIFDWIRNDQDGFTLHV